MMIMIISKFAATWLLANHEIKPFSSSSSDMLGDACY
jgi:hypothetical protein